MTTYIKDLIDLPERVHGGDFVLKLTEGVAHPAETLAQYVVTPELARNFDEALDFIKGRCSRTAARRPICTGASVLARVISWRCCICCWSRRRRHAPRTGSPRWWSGITTG